MDSTVQPLLDTAYQERIVQRVLHALEDHECLRSVTGERADALATYARRAIAIGAPFDRDILDALAFLSLAEIVDRSINLPDKLTPAARARHAQLAEMQNSARHQESVERFFNGKDTVTLPLLQDARGFHDRIAKAIEWHNTAVQDGTASERSRNTRLEQIPGTVENLLRVDRKNPDRKRTISTVQALAEARCWELAEDLERSRVTTGRINLFVESDYEVNLASRSLVQLHNIDPEALRIVYSCDYRLIGECSTGQRWSNCYTEDASNFTSVDAHIKHGGIVAYLVDQDDQDARYPFARILLTPKKAQRGEAIIYEIGRPYGSHRSSDDNVERFRSSVFDVARRFGEGSSGSFQRILGIPYSDTLGVPNRITVWTEQDLVKIADEAIDKSDRRRSVKDQIERKRRLENVWKERSDRALLSDVRAAWNDFHKAKPVVLALAREIGHVEAKCFIVNLRDHAFRYERGGAERLTELSAVEAMCPLSDSILAKLGEKERLRLEVDMVHLLRAVASVTDRGDVVACALIASLNDEQVHEQKKFERANELERSLDKVQEKRLQHLSKIANDNYYIAARHRDAMYNELTEVPNKIDAGAILDAFRNTWWSLEVAVKNAFSSSAWDRVRCVIVRDGMRAGLDCVERLCPRTLGWKAGAFKLVTGERGKALRDEAQSCARTAIDGFASRSDDMRRLLDASRWSHDLSSAEKNDLLLGVLETRRVPSRFVQPGGPLADFERQSEHSFYIAGDQHGERILARLLAPQLLEAAEASRCRAEAALQSAANQRSKPKQMPGWVGATEETLRAYCWLTDVALLEKKFTDENREARNRVNAEDIARRAHGIIRFHKHADLPEAGPLVDAVRRQLRERFPEYFPAASSS